MVTGGSCGARPPSCSVVRVAPARRCGFAGSGPAAVARIAPPFPLRGGRPPGPGGAEGRACGSPAAVGAGGGGGGASSPAPGSVRGGGGGWVGGGPLAPWRCLSSAVGGGAGAAWRPWSRGPAIGQGVAPFTRPPYRELDARAGPRRGPHLPGRCRAAPAGRGWPWGLAVSG